MDTSKIVAFSVGVAGLGILLFAISKVAKDKNANVYLQAGEQSNPFDSKAVASSLYNAMREANFTNTQKRKVILESLTGVTQNQFLQVIKAFGSRYYNTLTGNTYFAIWQTPVKHPLKVWLKEELSLEDYELLQSNYPKYL
jgi:hypothetical protein